MLSKASSKLLCVNLKGKLLTTGNNGEVTSKLLFSCMNCFNWFSPFQHTLWFLTEEWAWFHCEATSFPNYGCEWSRVKFKEMWVQFVHVRLWELATINLYYCLIAGKTRLGSWFPCTGITRWCCAIWIHCLSRYIHHFPKWASTNTLPSKQRFHCQNNH